MTDEEKERGRQLGQLLKALRGERTSEELARAADVRVDTLRRIESGGVPTPGFFTIGKIVQAAGGRLDALWVEATGSSENGELP